MNEQQSTLTSKTVSMPDQMRAAAVCIGMSWAEQEVRQRCFNALQKGADEIEQLRRNETTEALETCKFVKLATTEISRLRATLQKIIDEGDYTAPEGMKRSALAALGNKPHGNETFVIPVSPHMPKRERPAKAPSKSGLRYQQELAHYCGFRWQWLNLPPSEQLETLLEQLADAKDDALRLHHAYVDLKFPEMARPELKANALQPIPATEDDISHWWKCLNCHARNDPETYPVSCPCCATLRPTQNGGAERG